MPKSATALLVALVAIPSLSFAQDWTSSAPAGKRVLVDNPHFRLVDVVVAPGAEEPMHTHPEYVELVLGAAKLRVTYEGKAPESWNPETGKAYYGTGEPRHSLKNVDSKPLHLLLLELKDRPFVPSTAASSTGTR
jgi:quercetin dioxygenase-like cupin family protein